MYENSATIRSGGEKQAYLQNIQAMIAEKTTSLSQIKCKVQEALESQRIHPGDLLLKAEQQADSCIQTLQKQLDLLGKTEDASWEIRRFDVEMAWDELSQAIKQIVARFPLGSIRVGFNPGMEAVAGASFNLHKSKPVTPFESN